MSPPISGIGPSLATVPVIGGTPTDPDMDAFIATTGATDTDGLADLVAYLKAQGIFTSSVLWPCKSAQNYGSGTSVAPLGGATTNEMTLVGSPTWAAGGFTLNGTTQGGRVADYLGTETLTMFLRGNVSGSPASGDVVCGQMDSTLSDRSVWLSVSNVSGNKLLARDSVGNIQQATTGLYVDGATGLGSDTCHVAQWVDGGGRSLWADKAADSLALVGGGWTAQTARKNSSADVTMACLMDNGVPSGFHPMSVVSAFMTITGTLTTAQREAITDLINAL